MIILLPLLLIFHLSLLSQLIFTAWPEMLSYPYLYSQGFTLYKDFIMPYPPGLILLLGVVFNYFGFNPMVLKNLTWFLILIVDVSLFYLLKEVTKNSKTSLLFLFIFIILQSLLDGNMLWFDFALVIPLLLSLWFGLKKNFFLVGLFLMLAILIKQTAVVYILGFLGLLWILGEKRIQETLITIGGGTVLMVPLIIYLILTDSLIPFWNWTIFYPLTEWSKFPGYVQMTLNLKQIIFLLILIFPVAGVFFNFPRILKEKKIPILLIFIVSALIAIYPRFSYFHLQPVLPFLILLAAEIYILLKPKIKVIYISLVLMTLATISFFVGPDVWGQRIRFYDIEDQEMIADVKLTATGEREIFLQGLYSSIYVFSGTIPPKNWSDNFGWYLEIPGVQEWVLQGFEEEPPNTIFWRQPQDGRWYDLGTYQPQKMTEYIKRNYHKTGNIKPGIDVWQRN